MNNHPPIILHRTVTSAYSQKSIFQLQYSNLPWHSVLANKAMPRPIQQTLVGDFSRRIPILQVGADIYCDTKLISNKIAELAQQPNLSTQQQDPELVSLINHIEMRGLGAILGILTPWNFIAGYTKHGGIKNACDFIKDRAALAKQYPDLLKDRPSKNEAQQIAHQYFQYLEQQLDSDQFLYGDSLSAADFSAYTAMWYLHVLTNSKVLRNYPKLSSWLENMLALDAKYHRPIDELSGQRAIEIAKAYQPQAIDEAMRCEPQQRTVYFNDPLLGQNIKLGLNGLLIGESDNELIIERENLHTGKLHIHLPKQCFGACG